MKTSEQTKRLISVGLATLATTALFVMVTAATLFCGVTSARAQEPDNRIDWRWGRPGVMVVTNAPTAVTVTNIATEVATEVASGVADTMFGPRVTALEGALDGGTNNWNTAYDWGDHAGLYKASDWVPSWGDLTDIPQDFPPSTHEHDYTAVTNPPWLTEYTETDEIALAALYGTNTILEAAITNEAALRTAHTEDTGNPHDVTAAQIGAATIGELADVEAALAGYQSSAYWPPDATDSSWFTFTTNSGAITITGYDIGGGTDVVIPDYINGWPVTAIGESAFQTSGIVSVIAPQTVTTIGDFAFAYCSALTSVTIPQATTIGISAFNSCTALASVSLPHVTSIGDYAFASCYALTSVTIPQVTSIGVYAFAECGSLTSVRMGQNAPAEAASVFASITLPPNVYVTNPQATGWGATWNGAPVVRLDLHGDKIYQAGELVATTGHVAQAIAAIEFPVTSTNYTAWTGTITPADGTATVTIAHGNMPVLVTDASCVLTLDPTGYGTAGVSRVSLSYYPGTNSFTFATNVITYSATPNVDTNGWNSLLIRRVSNGAWKGVGL